MATREAGLKVAMTEADLLGGTCPNRGCMARVCRLRFSDRLGPPWAQWRGHVHTVLVLEDGYCDVMRFGALDLVERMRRRTSLAPVFSTTPVIEG